MAKLNFDLIGHPLNIALGNPSIEGKAYWPGLVSWPEDVPNVSRGLYLGELFWVYNPLWQDICSCILLDLALSELQCVVGNKNDLKEVAGVAPLLLNPDAFGVGAAANYSTEQGMLIASILYQKAKELVNWGHSSTRRWLLKALVELSSPTRYAFDRGQFMALIFDEFVLHRMIASASVIDGAMEVIGTGDCPTDQAALESVAYSALRNWPTLDHHEYSLPLAEHWPEITQMVVTVDGVQHVIWTTSEEEPEFVDHLNNLLSDQFAELADEGVGPLPPSPPRIDGEPSIITPPPWLPPDAPDPAPTAQPSRVGIGSYTRLYPGMAASGCLGLSAFWWPSTGDVGVEPLCAALAQTQTDMVSLSFNPNERPAATSPLASSYFQLVNSELATEALLYEFSINSDAIKSVKSYQFMIDAVGEALQKRLADEASLEHVFDELGGSRRFLLLTADFILVSSVSVDDSSKYLRIGLPAGTAIPVRIDGNDITVDLTQSAPGELAAGRVVLMRGACGRALFDPREQIDLMILEMQKFNSDMATWSEAASNPNGDSVNGQKVEMDSKLLKYLLIALVLMALLAIFRRKHPGGAGYVRSKVLPSKVETSTTRAQEAQPSSTQTKISDLEV